MRGRVSDVGVRAKWFANLVAEVLDLLLGMGKAAS